MRGRKDGTSSNIWTIICTSSFKEAGRRRRGKSDKGKIGRRWLEAAFPTINTREEGGGRGGEEVVYWPQKRPSFLTDTIDKAERLNPRLHFS